MHCTVLHKNQLRDELSFERLNAESFDQFFGAYTLPLVARVRPWAQKATKQKLCRQKMVVKT